MFMCKHQRPLRFFVSCYKERDEHPPETSHYGKKHKYYNLCKILHSLEEATVMVFFVRFWFTFIIIVMSIVACIL